MFISSGIDVVKIERFISLQNKTILKSFVKKVIPESIDTFYNLYSKNKLKSAAFLAKRFSMKESISKAIGCGICQDLSFSDMKIFNDKLGKPILEKNRKIKNAIIKYISHNINSIDDFSISISASDEKDLCVSNAIILW